MIILDLRHLNVTLRKFFLNNRAAFKSNLLQKFFTMLYELINSIHTTLVPCLDVEDTKCAITN